MKRILLLLLVLSSFSFLYAQEHKSIHQLDKEANPVMDYNKFRLPDLNKSYNIRPLNKSASNKLTRTVFGYLPYWEYKTAPGYLRFNLLSHIAAFDFPAGANGAIGIPSGWPWNAVLDSAHNNGVKVIMTVTCFSWYDINKLLADTVAIKNFYKNARTIILLYNLDGINIDFEGPLTADRGAPMNNFMKGLTDFLHKEIPGTEVSFAGPAINWGGWNLKGLANSCDYIFVMGYDFYGSWSSTSGPSAPLSGGYYNISTVLNSSTEGYASVVSTNPEKLILGVPYYGNCWSTKTSSAYSDTLIVSGKTAFKGSTRFKDDGAAVLTYGRLWDTKSQVPWYRYQLSTTWYQVWFDDAQSLGLKYDFAIAKNLKGVGMWALGYDGTRSELWDLLDTKFNPVVPVELVSFNAVMQGTAVRLSWRTITEVNNTGFQIERKTGNDDAFTKIAFIPARGSGLQPQNYEYTDKLLNAGSGVIQYRLKQIDSNGSFRYSGLVEVVMNPAGYNLSQNFPNPFNPATIIQYNIPEEALVTLEVFDMLGSRVRTLVNEKRPAGIYTSEFNAADLSAGIYFYTLKCGEYVSTKKMILLK